MEQPKTIDSELEANFRQNIELELHYNNIGSDAPYQIMETIPSTRNSEINNKQDNGEYIASKTIDIEARVQDNQDIQNQQQYNPNTLYQHNYENILFKADYTFFLFVNSTSGGNQAAEFMKLQTERLNFVINNSNSKESKDEQRVDVYIYDLKNTPNKQRGILLLKAKQDDGTQNIRVIVGGGDGTVMWVIQEMLSAKCDLKTTPIGIVPFGTGNDFARVLGWGGSAPDEFIGKNLKGLKEMIKKWIKARVAPFDIWEIKFKTNEDGSFKRIEKENGKAVKKEIKDSDGQILKTLKKPMSNYFSIGIDARIGLGFDKNRTTSQLGNKCIYCWEGFKKIFIKTQKIAQVIDALEVLHEEDISQDKISEIDISIEDKLTNQEIVFNTRSASMALTPQQACNIFISNRGIEIDIFISIQQLEQLRESQQERIQSKKSSNILKGNPACLLMLNINSYAGGTNKIWTSSQGQVGLEKYDHNKVPDQFATQNFGDGQIEFVSFTSAISLANERFFSGNASRVAQGKGPFLLKFKKMDGSKNKGKPIVSYFQIDGEYYQIESPQSVKIRLNKQLPDGKIQVLINTQGNTY